MSERRPSSWLTAAPSGVRILLRVTPRAKRTEVTGVAATVDGRGALAVRLAAPPVDGAANAELRAFLAKALGVPRSAVEIVSGETARTKIVDIAGDAPALEERLRTLLPDEV